MRVLEKRLGVLVAALIQIGLGHIAGDGERLQIFRAEHPARGLVRALEQRNRGVNLPSGLVQEPQIVDGNDGLRVIGAERGRQCLHAPLEKRLRLAVAALEPVQLRQIVHDLKRAGMVYPQDGFENGKHALQQRLGLGIAALGLINGRQAGCAQHRGRSVWSARLPGLRQGFLRDGRSFRVLALCIELKGLLVQCVDIRRAFRAFRKRMA